MFRRMHAEKSSKVEPDERLAACARIMTDKSTTRASTVGSDGKQPLTMQSKIVDLEL